jgi:hypothetical protein
MEQMAAKVLEKLLGENLPKYLELFTNAAQTITQFQGQLSALQEQNALIIAQLSSLSNYSPSLAERLESGFGVLKDTGDDDENNSQGRTLNGIDGYPDRGGRGSDSNGGGNDSPGGGSGG